MQDHGMTMQLFGARDEHRARENIVSRDDGHNFHFLDDLNL